jgi:ketosteroid isomerase-like protein
MSFRNFSFALLLVLAGLIFFLAPSSVWTQAKQATTQSNRKPPVSQKLYDEISHMDSVLFDAFNARDLDKIKTLFTEDLEFYHDKNGLVSPKQNIDNIKNLFDQNNGMRRELEKDSLEVYPIKDYGAIEIGAHSFSHVENGKEIRGTFKFVQIWRKKDGGWKVSRVISYDHK